MDTTTNGTTKPPLERKLSPSRASDFKKCPLKYRYLVIDKLPSKPSIEAVRGTHTHSILEKIFTLDKSERIVQTAIDLVDSTWLEMIDKYPSYMEIDAVMDIIANEKAQEEYNVEIKKRLENYFKLENPATLSPTALEKWIQTYLPNGVRLGGFIDRLEVAKGYGARISDYKTGKKPDERFEADALFQMYFYSLIYYKDKGEIPKMVRLLYLGDGQILEKAPDVAILKQFENDIESLWSEIEVCYETGSWQPKKSKLCDWCDFQNICPLFAV